jgi:hypothetical protein
VKDNRGLVTLAAWQHSHFSAAALEFIMTPSQSLQSDLFTSQCVWCDQHHLAISSLSIPLERRERLLLGPNDSAKSVLVLWSTSRTDPQISDVLSKLAGGRAPGDDGYVRCSLITNCDKISGLVDVECAGVCTVRRCVLREFERTIRSDGVLCHRIVGRELLVVTVGSVDEVALNANLSDLGTTDSGAVALVGCQALLQRQRHAASCRVGNGPAGKSVGKLIRDKEESAVCSSNTRRVSGRPESTMTRTSARRRFSSTAFSQLSSRLVDLVDADQISAKIRNQEEVASWVHERVMRMRRLLTTFVRTRSRVLERLDWLSTSQR